MKVKVNFGLKNYNCSKEENSLIIIYLIAFLSSVFFFFAGPVSVVGDTESYVHAKNILFIEGRLDHLRTPLYPVLLALAGFKFIIVIQYSLFLVSIYFFYKTLKFLKLSNFLTFVTAIIYVCHPVFLNYQNQLYAEGLCISISSILFYYLVKFVLFKKSSDSWKYYLVSIILIFLKPVFIFVLIVSFLLLVYLFITKEKGKILMNFFVPFIISIFLISSYILTIKKEYNFYGISSVSDVNLYWMLRENNQIDIKSIENSNLKLFLLDKVNVNYPYFAEYVSEARIIYMKFGFNELHKLVSNSLKKANYKFISSRTGKINENMQNNVGVPIDYFVPRFKPIRYLISFFSITFYQLIIALILYLCLVFSHIKQSAEIPILSILFLIYISFNLSTLILTGPNNYGRLIIPSISIILIVIMQSIEGISYFLNKNGHKFKLM